MFIMPVKGQSKNLVDRGNHYEYFLTLFASASFYGVEIMVFIISNFWSGMKLGLPSVNDLKIS